MGDAARRPGLWYHGWNIVAIGVTGQVAALALTLNCFSLFLHGWTEAFHEPVSAIALAVTGFGIACTIFAPMGGWVTDRFPARWIYGIALTALAACYVGIGFMTERWQLVLLYAAPLPLAIVFCSAVVGQALVSRWFVRRAGLAMGITAFGATLGGVIFPPIVVALLPAIGWRAVWWIFGTAILLVVMPITVLIARDRPGAEECAYYVGAGRAAVGGPDLRWRDILSSRNFWVTVFVFATAQSCFMSVSVNFAPLAADRGLDAGYTGGLLSLLSVAALCGKLCAGLLVDRYGNRLPMMLTPFCCALGMGIMAAVPMGLASTITGVMLVGMAGAMWTLLASTTAAEFGGRGFGRAYGLISATTTIATLVAPGLAKVQENTGSYVPGLAGLGIVALVGSGVAALLRQPCPNEGPADDLSQPASSAA